MVRTSQHRSHVVTGASQLQELKHLNATSLQIRKRTKMKERKKGGGGGEIWIIIIMIGGGGGGGEIWIIIIMIIT